MPLLWFQIQRIWGKGGATRLPPTAEEIEAQGGESPRIQTLSSLRGLLPTDTPSLALAQPPVSHPGRQGVCPKTVSFSGKRTGQCSGTPAEGLATLWCRPPPGFLGSRASGSELARPLPAILGNEPKPKEAAALSDKAEGLPMGTRGSAGQLVQVGPGHPEPPGQGSRRAPAPMGAGGPSVPPTAISDGPGAPGGAACPAAPSW